jgi:transposase
VRVKITVPFIHSLRLSVGELVDWIVRQAEQILALVGERDALRAELAQTNQHRVQREQKLEETARQAFRQAAPFRLPESRRQGSPRRPGRPKGHPGSYRPRPTRIDQHLKVLLEQCPHCQGAVQKVRDRKQSLEEIPPVQPLNIELITQAGYCPRCDREVRSTHPLPVSLAEGAAGVQLGPNALAIAVELNKVKGLSMRKTCATLQTLFGLKLSPGGLAQALARVARKMKGSYEQLIEQLRQASVVHADETRGWVGGPGYWLWVFTNADTTVYVVAASRGRPVVQGVLGADFPGVLVSDCLNVYDDATPVQHKCYSHHLVAVKEAREEPPQQGEGYLLEVRALLHTALFFKALGADPTTPRYQQCVARLEQRADQLLNPPRAQAQEERVRRRLWKQRDHLFTFLKYRPVEATNNRAERQLRPAVMARKISCGNKTDPGAATWQILTSLAVTAAQAGKSFAAEVRAAVRLAPSGGP